MRPRPERRLYAVGESILHCTVDAAPHGAREIDETEAASIKAARPKPTPAPAGDASRAATDMHAALGVLVDAVERQDAQIKTLAARIEAVIDASVVTDVVGD